jgi:hypothetical protein
MIRELFELARTKKACIIFFDEIDAIGGTRFDDGAGGDNEVQRTMLELINQLDGFDPRGNIKVLMATNRYSWAGRTQTERGRCTYTNVFMLSLSLSLLFSLHVGLTRWTRRCCARAAWIAASSLVCPIWRCARSSRTQTHTRTHTCRPTNPRSHTSGGGGGAARRPRPTHTQTATDSHRHAVDRSLC